AGGGAAGTATGTGSTPSEPPPAAGATRPWANNRRLAVTAPPSPSPNAAVVAKKSQSCVWIGAPYCTCARTGTAGRRKSRARSSDVTSTAAAPSFSSEQSNNRIGSADGGRGRQAADVIGARRIAARVRRAWHA